VTAVSSAHEENDVLKARVHELARQADHERALREAAEALREAAEAKLNQVMRAFESLKAELALLKHRIYAARAERLDTLQLELLVDDQKKDLESMARSLSADEVAEAKAEMAAIEEQLAKNEKDKNEKPRPSPKGRRAIDELDLPEHRCEILDPRLEGVAPRIGFEESYRIGYQRGGLFRIVIARAKYKVEAEEGHVETADVPKESLRRCMAMPSLVAKVLVDKYADGLPFYRQEDRWARMGLSLDRGTMCRWAEDAGATLGCIVQAMAADALANAFCLSTDATGVAIQPMPREDKKHQACKKGHFFVVLADRDHVFFEYQEKHTSAAVCEMFRGFPRYIQADANAVYDALFRGEARKNPEEDPPTEVGCWAHARRKFYEAAITVKDPSALDALLRIRDIYELDAKWKHLAPEKRKRMRAALLAPKLDAFFAWASALYATARAQRGPMATALGYVIRQKIPLMNFLKDGRLKLDNNRSERAVRVIAIGRKNWLFFGSDDHASAAANLFSLMASCKLHGLDPELYLAEVLRVLPVWPKGRWLDLSPKHWAATRATLDAKELAELAGDITVPATAVG